MISKMAATNHIWLLNMKCGQFDELNFKFYLSIHMWLMATILESTALESSLRSLQALIPTSA